MPKEKANIHNTLNVNALPLPISGGKEKDYTYSIHLSKLLRRLVRIAVPDIEHLTFSDVELLDDVMRFGNLSKVAKLHGCSQSTVSVHLRRIFDQLDERLPRLEILHVLMLEGNSIFELEQKLHEYRQRRESLELKLSALNDETIDLSRRLAISSAHVKSMAVEAHLREQKHIVPGTL